MTEGLPAKPRKMEPMLPPRNSPIWRPRISAPAGFSSVIVPLQVGAEQAFAHALDNVFILRLQACHLAAFVAQLTASLAQTFRQIAGKIGHGKKTKKAGADFHLQGFHQIRGQRGAGGQELQRGNWLHQSGKHAGQIDEFNHRPHHDETDGRHQKGPSPGKENAGKYDGHQIKREIIALQIAGNVNDGRDNDDIARKSEGRPAAGNQD